MLLAWCDGRPPEIVAAGPKGAAGTAGGAAAGGPRGAARLIGTSRLVETVRQSVARLAAFPAPVLICGEPGSGKRIVARALHESGPRAAAPFVEVGCGEIAASLLPQELFGRGAPAAFRGAIFEAGDGSLLLRDVDRLPPEMQEALLEVIETGEVRSGGDAQPRRPSCRILTTASVDLAGLVEAGRFNSGLFERLRRMAIAVPALAERPEDIPALAGHFLAAGRSDGQTPRISDALRTELMLRPWPGSVTELMECVERMRLTGSEKLDYDLADLPPAANGGSPSTSSGPRAASRG
jgi:DNA-binding NtrC family response regulator